MTPDFVLHGISHANLMLYAAAVPPIDTSDKKTGSKDDDDESKERNLENLDWGGALDCNNPDNFIDLDLPEEE